VFEVYWPDASLGRTAAEVPADVFASSASLSLAAAAMLQHCVSRPQAELRPKGSKMEAAGLYYGKDQADKEHSETSYLSTCGTIRE